MAQQIVTTALDYAKKNDAARVTQFNVELSSASHESEDSLRFHFENLVRDTMAEGAKLEIAHVPAELKCLNCGNEFTRETDGVRCPKCHSVRTLPVVRDEFKLVSIEVD